MGHEEILEHLQGLIEYAQDNIDPASDEKNNPWQKDIDVITAVIDDLKNYYGMTGYSIEYEDDGDTWEFTIYNNGQLVKEGWAAKVDIGLHNCDTVEEYIECWCL